MMAARPMMRGAKEQQEMIALADWQGALADRLAGDEPIAAELAESLQVLDLSSRKLRQLASRT